MSDFNPNAYGRPMVKPSSAVMSSNIFTPNPTTGNESLPYNTNTQIEADLSSARLETWSSRCDEQHPWQHVKQQSIHEPSNHPTDTKHTIEARSIVVTDETSGADPSAYAAQDHSSLNKQNFEGDLAVVPQMSTTYSCNQTRSHELSDNPEAIRNLTSKTSQKSLDILRNHRSSTPEDQANGGAVIATEMSSLDNKKIVKPISQTPPDKRPITTSPTMPSESILTPEELLSKARGASLKKIQLRNKAKEKHSTTSLNDLSLARTPISDSKTQSLVGSRDLSATLEVESRLSVRGANNKQQPTPPKSAKRKASRSEKPHSAQPTKKTNASGSATDKGQSGNRTLDLAEDNLQPQIKLRPAGLDRSSDAPRSPMASNASEASNDSVTALHAGKAIHPLMGWDGNFQPPPAEWSERHGFDDDSVLREDVEQWTDDLCHLTTDLDDRRFISIPHMILGDVNDNPDGISIVPKYTTIDQTNANRYGYNNETIHEVIKHANPLITNDFRDWGKMDKRRPENALVENETAEHLIKNWMRHHKIRQMGDAQMENLEDLSYTLPDCAPTPNPNRPVANIYLRPACNIDVPQMTGLYNWYIQNTPRPAETMPVAEEEIQDRLDDVRSAYLPFLVAVDRSLRSVPSDAPSEEKILGWACAQNFTASDYIERISVELELYVHPEYRQLGVGRCLMDKLIEACDRGYMKRGGYPFRCPQEHIHLYSPGGGRDLHKLVFILRKWKTPRGNHNTPAKSKHPKANLKMKPNDQEDDYNLWIKDWLESWGFEVEGVLKGVGAKIGRFVDVVHFGRETRWQPMEGKIPDPLPRMF